MQGRIERLEDAFRSFGYVIVAEPILGSEDLFCDKLDEALSKIERKLASNRKRYGYRGKSKTALSALHFDIPNPCFGVIVERCK